MPDWQLTATTIFCDDCGTEVTVIVYKDGQVKCTGASSAPPKSKKPAAGCSADKCQRVADYKAKLDAEERGG